MSNQSIALDLNPFLISERIRASFLFGCFCNDRFLVPKPKKTHLNYFAWLDYTQYNGRLIIEKGGKIDFHSYTSSAT